MNSPILAPLLAGNVIGSIDNAFVIAEWRDAGAPPGPPRLIAPLHVHHRDDEAWYVLEGILRVKVGEGEVEAGAGSAVFVPRGTPHTYWNPAAQPVVYCLVMTSTISRLIKELPPRKARPPAVLRAVFEKYDSELLDIRR